MTNEMILSAERLEQAAIEYKKIWIKENGDADIVWITRDETGESVFITDGYISKKIKDYI